MPFSYRYGTGATAVNNRTSWGPISSPHVDVSPKSFNRPLSGNFDRIINPFERTNAFEYVKSKIECDDSRDEVFEKIVEKAAATEERFVAHGDLVVNRKMSSSYERAGGNLATQTPCTEDDVDLYQERIMYSQARQLFPLQEDLADWISKTIGITYLTGENFLDVLDNGVELCQLASVIVDKAKDAVQRGVVAGPVPKINGRCWQRAARRSFFSRDNMENFITFCRDLGVHENLLFESDDLVLHNQPRQVILCLLELARLVAKYDIEPPGLVQLEKEIALEERDSGLDSAMSGVGWQFRDTAPADERDKTIKTDPSPSPVGNADKPEYQDNVSENGSADSDVPLRPTNELDKRVQIVTRLLERNCNCTEGKCSKLLKVKKVGEGRYNIAGRNVFIRLLKGRHMMVRVGGGWDTLEHFLSRHDPCQVRLVSQSKHRTDITTLPLHPSTTSDSDLSLHSEHSVDISPITKSRTGKTTPDDEKLHASPTHSKCSSGRVSPLHEDSGRRTSTPTRPRSLRILKQSLTLPLNGAIHSDQVNKGLGKEGMIPVRRKQSAPSNLGIPGTPKGNGARTPVTENARSGTMTPVTSKKGRSMSLASVQPKEGKFCGTDRLNQAASKTRPTSLASTPTETRKEYQLSRTPPRVKTGRSLSLASTPIDIETKQFGTDSGYGKKTRSMSLASPVTPKPLKKNISARSLITPAAIEESIRNSLSADALSNNKPFLHIKAKYRSPPPREVPPR